jgi:hypothetical protein
MLQADPIRVNERIDRLDPKLTASITEIEHAVLRVPQIDNPDPILKKLRMDSDDPKLVKLSTDNVVSVPRDVSRTCLNTDMDDPSLKYVRKLRLLPMCT